MDLGLDGRVALITGGSDGIGRACARRLAQEGARVAIVARRPEPLAVVADEITRAGGSALAIACDVGAPGEVERAVAETVAHFGRLDILVSNAGAAAAASVEDVDDAAWDADLALKVGGATRAMRVATPHLRASGAGRIVSVLSIGGKNAGAGSLPSSASRAAGLAITKAASLDLAADAITVNAICIGYVKSGQWERRWEAAGRPGSLDDYYAAMARTRAVPLGRVGQAEEAADVVCFLASARAAFVTGVAINVDGGQSPSL